MACFCRCWYAGPCQRQLCWMTFRKRRMTERRLLALFRLKMMSIIWDFFSVFHNDPRVSDTFSCLLDTPVASLRYVCLSLDERATLGAYIRGLIESQSFFFLGTSICFCHFERLGVYAWGDIFHHLATSLTVLLTSRAMAPSFAMSFMKQYHCKTFVSHLRLQLLLLCNMHCCRLLPQIFFFFFM